MEIYALAAFCWGIGGIINGVTGFGLALVAMPLFSQYVDLIYVVPACTLIAISMNIQLSWTYRHSTDWAGLRPLIIGAFPGAIIGATVLSRMSEPGIKLLMGILLLGYSLWSLFFPPHQQGAFLHVGAILPACAALPSEQLLEWVDHQPLFIQRLQDGQKTRLKQPLLHSFLCGPDHGVSTVHAWPTFTDITVVCRRLRSRCCHWMQIRSCDIPAFG